MYELNNNVIYFDSFGDEHILKEIKFFGNKNIQTNIFRIQAYNSVMGGCVDIGIGFIDSMLKEKSLTNFTNLFPPNDLKKKKKKKMMIEF